MAQWQAATKDLIKVEVYSAGGSRTSLHGASLEEQAAYQEAYRRQAISEAGRVGREDAERAYGRHDYSSGRSIRSSRSNRSRR